TLFAQRGSVDRTDMVSAGSRDAQRTRRALPCDPTNTRSMVRRSCLASWRDALQSFAQHFESPMQVDAHRSGCEPVSFGDFRTGHPFDQPHHDGLAIGVWECADRCERATCLELVVLSLGHRGLLSKLDTWWRATDRIDNHMTRDRRQPSAKSPQVPER